MAWLKWLKWILLAVLVSVVIGTIGRVAYREWIRSQGESEFAAAVAETELTDPDWRWEALNKSRRWPPPERNSAALIPRFKALLPPDWDRKENPKQWEPIQGPQPPNQRLSEAVIAQTRRELGPAKEAVDLARTFKDFPDGNRVLILAPNVIGTLLPDTVQTRMVAQLLRWDTVLAVADGDSGRAADDLLAALNVSRSVGDEPFLVSQMIRLSTRDTGVRPVEWVLGQMELPESRLAVLQDAWAKDAEEPLFLYGVRGERAGMDILFQNMTNGTVSLDASVPKPGITPISLESLGLWLYRGRLPRERAAYHRGMTKAVDAARLPVHEQAAAIDALPPPPGDDMKLASLVLPAVEKVAATYVRSVAKARCVAVALACERFRLKTGKWPARLVDVPKELLPIVPLDPYDGKPLRYRVFDNGVAVYSVGKNGSDDGGAISNAGKPAGRDEGVRLWNPTDRGAGVGKDNPHKGR